MKEHKRELIHSIISVITFDNVRGTDYDFTRGVKIFLQKFT